MTLSITCDAVPCRRRTASAIGRDLRLQIVEPLADGGGVVDVGLVVTPGRAASADRCRARTSAEYSYTFTPRNTQPSRNVSRIQPLAFDGLVELGRFEREHDRHAGADQHERVERADRLAEVHIVRRGQATAPNRSTMYVPIRPAKNMISVERNNHRHVLPLGIGKAGWYSNFGSGMVTHICVMCDRVRMVVRGFRVLNDYQPALNSNHQQQTHPANQINQTGPQQSAGGAVVAVNQKHDGGGDLHDAEHQRPNAVNHRAAGLRATSPAPG